MKKFFKKAIGIIACATIAVCGVPALVACGDGGDDVAQCRVTFDYGYDGVADSVVSVNNGETVAEPEAPTREGYTFDCWLVGEEQYDFTLPVTSDVTLTAGWIEGSAWTVTLKYNNGTADGVRKVKDQGRLTGLGTPTYNGYDFYGWYTDEACTAKFGASAKFSADATLYALWGKIETFEAEDVDFSEFIGAGYSNAIVGTGGIYGEDMGAKFLKASNGYFVTGLYQKNDNAHNTDLVFKIHSTAAVTGATLRLRLSAEFGDIVLDGANWLVLVNGKTVTWKESVSLAGSKNSELGGVKSEDCLAFADYVISNEVNLVEGDNTVILRVNNNDTGKGGTMHASAPMVDCLKLSAPKTALTWAEGYPIVGNYGNED